MRSVPNRRATLFRRWCVLLALTLIGPAHAKDAPNPKKLVADAWTTLGNFIDDPELGQFRWTLGRAKAILIIPEMVRAGFIVGGAGGAGALLARQSGKSGWSQPAFFNLGGASLGLQAGAEVSQVIYLVMTEAGLKQLLESKVKLGGGVSVAAGPTGVGTSGTVDADLLSFARGKGLYAGVVGKGMAAEPDTQAVELYYGRAATPEEILIKKQVYNRDASKLVSLVAKAARPQTKKK